MRLRILTSDAQPIAFSDDGKAWSDPYGGTFTADEQEALTEFASGHGWTVCVGGQEYRNARLVVSLSP